MKGIRKSTNTRLAEYMEVTDCVNKIGQVIINEEICDGGEKNKNTAKKIILLRVLAAHPDFCGAIQKVLEEIADDLQANHG